MVEALEPNLHKEADVGYVKPKKKLGILIGISDYSQIRRSKDKSGFGDLPNALQNVDMMKTGLQEFGFMQDEITAKKTEADY